MKAIYCSTLFLSSFVMVSVSAEINYIPTGPQETVTFEKALLEASPEYVEGIFPRDDILKAGIPKKGIPSHWIQMTETWLKKVLSPDMVPGPKTKIAMYGLPELRWKSDYIVGYYVTNQNSEPNSRVEFQTTDRHLSITILLSKQITDVNALSDDDVLEMLKKYTAVPEAKLAKISIEKTHKALDRTRICYGKMRCEFHELRVGMDKEKNRRWWSYIPFWITENKFYISVSTIEWEKDKRPANASSRLFRTANAK